jgi:hypothetical protein
MSFFNKKEDVISIELTPYGRSLLSAGKLMPEYYAFFDDDILYDTEAAGFSELNNEIFQRIIEETPRLRPQRDVTSVENTIFNFERSEENSRPHTKTKLNYYSEPLGTSNQVSDDGPSWKVTLLQGEITGSIATQLSGSDVYMRQIPQINCDIEYTMQIRNTADDPPVAGQSITPTTPVSSIYNDGTYIELIEEQILAQIKENEGFLFKDGIEVEVYLFDDTEQDNLIPLKFLPEQNRIVNGFLIEEELANIDITPEYVEYYINFNVDSEISNEDICKGVNKLKSLDLQVGIEVECEDTSSVDYNIYGTRVGDSDLEICD